VPILRTSVATGVRVRINRGGEVEFSGAITEEFIRMLLSVMREPVRVH
jgi:hypothetical protein